MLELTRFSYGNALLTFDPKAEARLRWKIDLYIIPTVALLYLFCFIDRANIGNARLAGLEKDLGLKGYDYNQVLSVFYISYIIFEVRVHHGRATARYIASQRSVGLTPIRFPPTSAASGSVLDGSSLVSRSALVLLPLARRLSTTFTACAECVSSWVSSRRVCCLVL